MLVTHIERRLKIDQAYQVGVDASTEIDRVTKMMFFEASVRAISLEATCSLMALLSESISGSEVTFQG